jgi:hypothetical protein
MVFFRPLALYRIKREAPAVRVSLEIMPGFDQAGAIALAQVERQILCRGDEIVSQGRWSSGPA